MNKTILVMAVMVMTFSQTLPLAAQFREYLVEGRILDSQKNPLGAVTVELQDTDSSRSYSFKSNAEGIYRFIGIPHGKYRVSFSKDGWKTISTEWDLSTPQQRMQKVMMEDAVMVSMNELAQIEQNRAIRKTLDEARILYESKDYEAVIDHLTPVYAAYPDDLHTAYLLAMATLAKGDVHRARELFGSITVKYPEFTEATVQLGLCHQKLNQLDLALEQYEIADRQRPDQFMVRYNMGMIHYMQQRPRQALDVLSRALKHAPENDLLLETIAMCHIQLKEYEKGLEYLKKAFEKSSDASRKAAIKELLKDLQNGSNSPKEE